MNDEETKAQAIRESHRRWEQTRCRGRQRYVWVQGVLAWGCLFAIALYLGQIIAGRFHPVATLATAALCAVGGYLIGVVKWKHNERAYRTGHKEEIA